VSKRAIAIAVLMLAAIVALAGCKAVRGLIDTEEALQRAGFENIDITVDDSSLEMVQVEAEQATPHDNPNDAVAEVVWKEFPFRFDRLNVFVSPEPSRSYSREELTGLFGERPPGLDDKSLEDSLRDTGIVVLVVLGIAFLGFLALVALTIVLVVRARRKRRAQAPTQWGPPGQWGPGPWGPPGQAQQPPPMQQQPPPTPPTLS
jgi:hypothetical protein